MKCSYCNTELKDGARFCHKCGKKVIETNPCIKCGKEIKVGSLFCPYCGTEQNEIEEEVISNHNVDEIEEIVEQQEKEVVEQQEEEIPIAQEEQTTQIYLADDTLQANETNKSTKPRWLAVAVFILAFIGFLGYYISNHSHQEEVEIDKKTAFIEDMYEDIFKDFNFNRDNPALLKKYLSDDVMEKIYIECPYDGCEGEFNYETEVLRDGSLSAERPDFGNKVINRVISSIGEDWFTIQNYWDWSEEPAIVRLKVEKVDGNYKITDLSVNEPVW